MKSIIDGRRYDTGSSERIFEWGNGKTQGDFRLREKTLYRTKNGSYFILHYGGAFTDMGVPVASGLGGSSKIEPVSDEDAFGFLCSHGGEDDAEKLFPDKIKDA